MKNEVTMTKTDKYLLWGMVAGLSLMLILRDVNGISINKFIYFGFAVALMAIASYRVVVYMVCFILPLVCGLPGTYIMPCALVLLAFKRGQIKAMQLIPILLILLLELVAALWYPSMAFAGIVNYVSFAAIMVFLVQDDREVDYRQCVKLYLLGTLVLCGVILYVSLESAPPKWMDLFAEGQFRIGQTVEEGDGMKLSLNANSLAYYTLVGMACSLLLLEIQKKYLKRILLIAAIILFAVTGFLTVSRSWIIIAAMCLVLYVVSKVKSPKQFLLLLAVLALLIGATVWYLNKNPELLAGFETRFNDDTMESGGSRTNILKKYMEVFFSNIRFVFLGTGVTQGNVVAGMTGSMHNGTQQILVCCGSVGFVLYMVVLIGATLKAGLGKKISLVYWLPLISVVVFTQTIQFLNPTMLMLPFIIGIYALKTGRHTDK